MAGVVMTMWSRLATVGVALVLGASALVSAPVAGAADTMVTLSGTVTRSDGSPVAGLNVAWGYGQYGSGGGLNALTRADGTYSMDVSPGLGQISFQTAGGDTASDVTLPKYFEWKANGTLSANTTWDLVLPPLRTITFDVRDAGGAPIGNARIISDDYTRCTTPWTPVQPVPCFWMPRPGYTDEFGEYSVVVFDKDNTEPFSFTVTAPNEGGMVLASGLVDADVTLPVTVTPTLIAGTVVTASSQGDPVPVEGAYVDFEVPGVTYKQVRTDASGAFTLNVPPISGRLSVQTYRVDNPNGSPTAATPTMPTIRSWTTYDASTSREDVVLTLPESRSIAVTVLDDSTDDPVEGASIRVQDTANNKPTEAPCTRPLVPGTTAHCLWTAQDNPVTDNQGATTVYVVSVAESGPYALVATHPTNTARSGQTAGSDEDLTIRILGAPTVSGTVTTESGAPMRNIRISFINYTTNAELSTVTDSTGAYSLEASPGWGYLYVSGASDESAYDAGSHPTSPDSPLWFGLNREHTQGTTSITGIDLVMPDVTVQTFRVVDSGDVPVPNAKITGNSSSCFPLPSANTLTWRACDWSATRAYLTADADGYFSVRTFAGRSIRIAATDPANAGRTGWAQGPFTASEVTPIVLPDPPAPPAAVDATAPSDTTVDVAWQPPTDDGGSAITGYEVTAEPEVQAAPLLATAPLTRSTSMAKLASLPAATTTAVSLGPDARSTRITGLTPGVTYVVSVRATNAVGLGQPKSTTITPGSAGDPPSAPGSPTATAGDASATVSWQPATTAPGLPILDYTVTSSPGGLTCTTSSLSCTVTGLTNGAFYTFTVHARNAVGDGPESAATLAVAPKGAPGPVGSLTATATAPKQLSVSWTAASANGSPITRYEYRYRKESAASFTAWTSTRLSTAVSIKKLSSATAFVVEVRAVNAVGSGAISSVSATTR